jgi:hypothetical protein
MGMFSITWRTRIFIILKDLNFDLILTKKKKKKLNVSRELKVGKCTIIKFMASNLGHSILEGKSYGNKNCVFKSGSSIQTYKKLYFGVAISFPYSSTPIIFEPASL